MGSALQEARDHVYRGGLDGMAQALATIALCERMDTQNDLLRSIAASLEKLANPLLTVEDVDPSLPGHPAMPA